MYVVHASRETLEKSLQRLKKADLIELLGRAFDELPKSKRAPVFGGLLEPMPTSKRKKSTAMVSARTLLKEVVAFHANSRKGHYYDSFAVNSKNYRDESEGTAKWRREANRLFDKCISASRNGDATTVGKAFELLFSLLLGLDNDEDIVFFADEGGSWQIGAEYEKIFPAYFSCLAQIAEPDVYARMSCALIAFFAGYAENEQLKTARSMASKEQKRAIAEYLKDKPRRWDARRWLKDAIGEPK